MWGFSQQCRPARLSRSKGETRMRKICPFAVAATLILAGVAGWVGSATYARVHAPLGGGIDPLQLMTHAKDLPAAEFVDHSFVFN